MKKVIQFRSNIASFDDAEFSAFENKLFTTYGKRQLLSKALFSMMSEQCMQN